MTELDDAHRGLESLQFGESPSHTKVAKKNIALGDQRCRDATAAYVRTERMDVRNSNTSTQHKSVSLPNTKMSSINASYHLRAKRNADLQQKSPISTSASAGQTASSIDIA